ncbi:hypothetical protein AYI70_g1352 [Smittium culicis]|uniref:Uncharacterized protein n=1 Tax=Smittium culicis TaxID=133412 RepID=A0A1R1X8N3_9FUNG|nr:hypothetical protein AYI70_g9976 [Smittium culicis]OMJ24760.1 hypothetical protein AYI70_g1352 [Smittium culicis]
MYLIDVPLLPTNFNYSTVSSAKKNKFISNHAKTIDSTSFVSGYPHKKAIKNNRINSEGNLEKIKTPQKDKDKNSKAPKKSKKRNYEEVESAEPENSHQYNKFESKNPKPEFEFNFQTDQNGNTVQVNSRGYQDLQKNTTIYSSVDECSRNSENINSINSNKLDQDKIFSENATIDDIEKFIRDNPLINYNEMYLKNSQISEAFDSHLINGQLNIFYENNIDSNEHSNQIQENIENQKFLDNFNNPCKNDSIVIDGSSKFTGINEYKLESNTADSRTLYPKESENIDIEQEASSNYSASKFEYSLSEPQSLSQDLNKESVTLIIGGNDGNIFDQNNINTKLSFKSILENKTNENTISNSITDVTSCSSLNIFESDLHPWGFHNFEEGSNESFATAIGGLCKYPTDNPEIFPSYPMYNKKIEKDTESKPLEFSLNQSYQIESFLGNVGNN